MQNDLSKMNGRQYIDYLRAKQTDRIMPFSITFELTPLCNFRCKMCYIRLEKDQLHASGKILSIDEWIGIANQAKDAGVFKIVFTGGEVFSYPHFQMLYDMGFHISIISNGYLIDEKAALWLRKRKPDFIKITLYGASNEIYKEVCGVDDGFTKVTSNIIRLRKMGISVLTCMTVIEDNRKDVEEVRNWAESQNLQFVSSKVIRKKAGNAYSNPESARVSFDFETDVKADDIRHTIDLFPKKNNSPFENCVVYHNSCIISWNGKVKGCNFINSITSDIREGELLECFKELWAKLDTIRRPKRCMDCQYLRFCNPCPGTLEGESGNPEEPSKYVCDLAKWRFYNLNIDKSVDCYHEIEPCE